MKRVCFLVCWCAAASAASLHLEQSGFAAAADGRPAGWTFWSARAETAPRVFVDSQHYRTRLILWLNMIELCSISPA